MASIGDYFSDLGGQIADAYRRRGVANAAGTAVVGGIGALDPTLRAVHQGMVDAAGNVMDAGASVRRGIGDFVDPALSLYSGGGTAAAPTSKPAAAAPVAAPSTPAIQPDDQRVSVASVAQNLPGADTTATSTPAATGPVSNALGRITASLRDLGLSDQERAGAATFNPDTTAKAGTYRIATGVPDSEGQTFVRIGADGMKSFIGAGDPNAPAALSGDAYIAKNFPRDPNAAGTFAGSGDPRLATGFGAPGPNYDGFFNNGGGGRLSVTRARVVADAQAAAAREETARRGQDIEAQSRVATNLPQLITAQAGALREQQQAPLYAAQTDEARARAVKEAAQTKSFTADEQRKQQIIAMQDQLANETDPKRAAALEKRLTTMQGKVAENYQPIVGKDLEGNTQIIGVLDRRSGEIVKPETNTPTPKFEEGKTYVDAKGNKAVYRNGKFEAQ